MVSRSHQPPRSCDFLDLVGGDRGSGASTRAGRGFLVWVVDDQGTVVVRSAASLPEACEVARAYCAAWGGQVQLVEGPGGELVDRTEWEQLAEASAPLPYVYTVELRSPSSRDGRELIAALWTSTDLASAMRWRSLLPDELRGRTLVVSNAPDGHYPHRTPNPPRRK